ncbi:MAG: hypothetical protein WC906_00285 [Parcubacteria group bacterium]|jgi:hypothetical protein
MKKLIKKYKIKEDLKLFEAENNSSKIYQIHKGYYADSFMLSTGKGDYFFKKFDSKRLAKEEIESYNDLVKIKSDVVIVPNVKTISQKVICMDYYNGIGFYHYLIKSIFWGKMGNIEKKFVGIGNFLANFHNENFIRYSKENIPISKIHGDLNEKNLIFLDNEKVVILDPMPRKELIYEDILRFIKNIYPTNLIYEMLLFRQRKLITRYFLDGYMQNSKFEIKEDLLNKIFIELLKKGKPYMSSSFIYRLKKFIINLYLNYLIKKFENGKLQIKLY